jgi:hypothetical protein
MLMRVLRTLAETLGCKSSPVRKDARLSTLLSSHEPEGSAIARLRYVRYAPVQTVPEPLPTVMRRASARAPLSHRVHQASRVNCFLSKIIPRVRRLRAALTVHLILSHTCSPAVSSEPKHSPFLLLLELPAHQVRKVSMFARSDT